MTFTQTGVKAGAFVPEKEAAGNEHSTTALVNNTSNLPETLAQEKRFNTLVAQFALLGHTFHKSRLINAKTPYFAQRWGQVLELESLDAAEGFLKRIGGLNG